MTENFASVWAWIAAVLAGIVASMVGVFYYIGRKRDEDQDQDVSDLNDSLKEHIDKDLEGHSRHGERIAKLEARTDRHDVELERIGKSVVEVAKLEARTDHHDVEIARIGKGVHDVRAETRDAMMKWVTELFSKLRG